MDWFRCPEYSSTAYSTLVPTIAASCVGVVGGTWQSPQPMIEVVTLAFRPDRCSEKWLRPLSPLVAAGVRSPAGRLVAPIGWPTVIAVRRSVTVVAAAARGERRDRPIMFTLPLVFGSGPWRPLAPWGVVSARSRPALPRPRVASIIANRLSAGRFRAAAHDLRPDAGA